jgi:hypothetical protein
MSARDRNLLLLAAGQAPGEISQPFAQPRQQREDALEIGRDLAIAPQVGAHQQIFFDREPAEEPAPLRHLHDAGVDDPLRCGAGELALAEANASIPHADEAAHRAEQRRLSGPVRTDQRDDFTGSDLERDVPEHLRVAVPGREPVNAQSGAHSVPSPRVRSRKRFPR